MCDYRYIIFSVFFVALAGLVFSCAFPMLHVGEGFSSSCMPLATFVSVDRPSLVTLLLLLVVYMTAILVQKLITLNRLTGFLGPPYGYLSQLGGFNFNNPVSGFVLVRTTHRKVF